MRTSTIELPTADGPMPVYEAVPDGGATRAVVVIQEAFGVNEHIQDVTRRVAELGYHAVAPHMFHRTGSGVVPYGQYDKVLEQFAPLADEGIVRDVDAALAHLESVGIGPASTGITGFCFGGRVSFLVSLRRKLGAGVGFYGGGIVTSRFPQFPTLVEEVGALQTPWLGLFGDEDHSIPESDVTMLRAELHAKAPVDNEVVLYRGAGHGFFRDVTDDHRPDAAADAWQRLQDWFAAHLA